jgi:hypothetical protein
MPEWLVKNRQRIAIRFPVVAANPTDHGIEAAREGIENAFDARPIPVVHRKSKPPHGHLSGVQREYAKSDSPRAGDDTEHKESKGHAEAQHYFFEPFRLLIRRCISLIYNSTAFFLTLKSGPFWAFAFSRSFRVTKLCWQAKC